MLVTNTADKKAFCNIYRLTDNTSSNVDYFKRKVDVAGISNTLILSAEVFTLQLMLVNRE